MGGFSYRLMSAIFHSICFRYLVIDIEDDISAWAEVWAMAWLSILTVTAPAGPMAAKSGIPGGDDDEQFLRPGAQIATLHESFGMCVIHTRSVGRGRCFPSQIIAQGCLLWSVEVDFLGVPTIGYNSHQSNNCQKPSKLLHYNYYP